MSHIQLNRQPPRLPRVLFGQSHYVKGKTPRFSGVYLGLLDESSMELIQSRKLKELTPEMRDALSHRGISFGHRHASPPGRRPDKDKPVRLGMLSGAGHEEVGVVRVLQHLSGTAGLSECLRASFGGIGDNLFVLACHQVAERGRLYLAEAWAEATPFRRGGLSSPSVSRLLEGVGRDVDARMEFHRSWYRACGSPKLLVHDTTSISGYSGEMREMEWGYNRDREKMPQINMASVYALALRLPVFYRVLPGSIPDIASLVETNDYMELLGICDYQYVLDKGYFSDENARDMLGRGLDFTAGAKWNNQLLGLLRRSAGALHSARGKSIVHGGRRILWAQGKYVIEQDDRRLRKTVMTAYIYYSPVAAAELMEKLEATLEELVRKSRKERFATEKEARHWVQENCGGYSGCLVTVPESARKRKTGTGDGLGVLLDRSARGIREYGETFGASAVVTSVERQDAAVTFERFHSRDPIEKMYDILKNELDCNRLYTGKDAMMEGRLFVAFLGTIIHSMLENLMRERGVLKTVTVREAIVLLAKVTRTRFDNGREIKHDIPKKARELIVDLGLQEIFSDYREFSADEKK